MEGSLILLMPNLFLILSWYLSCELFFVWIQFFRSGSISITKHSLRSPNFLSISVTPAECAFFFLKISLFVIVSTCKQTLFLGPKQGYELLSSHLAGLKRSPQKEENTFYH